MIDTYAIDHAVPAPLLAEGEQDVVPAGGQHHAGQGAGARPGAGAEGGTVGGDLPSAVHTHTSSPVLAAQSSGAQVVALMNVGGDLVDAAKQASEFVVIAGGQKLAGFWTTTTGVHAIGFPTAQGIYCAEAFCWDQDDRVGAMPNSFQAGIYGAVTHYLKAAATADAATVMAKMRELPVEDFMTRHGTVRPDGRVVRDIQTLQVKAPADSSGEWDLARVVATIPAGQAFRPLADSDGPPLKQ